MKTFLSAIAVSLFVPMAAFADATYTYPKESPGLSVTIPEGWEKSDEDDGETYVFTSPDEEISFYLWSLKKTNDPKKMLEQLEETAKEVAADIKTYVDDFEVEESKRAKLNDLDAAMFGGTGESKEDGEEVNVEVYYMTPDDKQVFVLMYWGSDAAEKTHKEALAKISASLKKAS